MVLRKAPLISSLTILFVCLYAVVQVQHDYIQRVSGQAYSFFNPHTSILTAFSWIKTYPDPFIKWCVICGVGVFCSIFAYAYSFYALRVNKPIKDMHGTARFATRAEIKKNELLDNKGVVIGGLPTKSGGVEYLRHDGAEHCLVVAPTRSGKGVSVVLPTLLTWQESAIVTDFKGELWALTSGWRNRHANQNCYRFDVTGRDSAKFNPLDTIRIGDIEEFGDSQNIATTLVDQGGGMEGSDSHWKKSAQALLAGLIVYATNMARLEGKSASLHDVALLIMPPDEEFEDVLQKGLEDTVKMSDSVAEFIKSSFRQHLEREGAEAASVVSTTANYLTLFKDPVIANNTGSSDFSVEDLVDSDNAATLYLVINPNDKTRLMPVTRLVITVLLRKLTSRLEFVDNRAQSAYARRCLLLLDEFPALGKMEVLTDTLAYMSTYGIKALLICQDYKQLWDKYTRNESISGNCHVRVAFAPNVLETAKEISGMTGQSTVVKQEKTNVNTKIGMWSPKHDRFSETARPLMTPEEVMRLKGLEKEGEVVTGSGEVLIFVAGHHPIKGVQPLYFQSKHMVARSNCGAAEKVASYA